MDVAMAMKQPSKGDDLKEKPLTASWLLGILVGVIILGGGSWCTLTLKKVFDLEAGDTKRQVEITEIKMEQKTQGVQLNRIERKLDRISDSGRSSRGEITNR